MLAFSHNYLQRHTFTYGWVNCITPDFRLRKSCKFYSSPDKFVHGYFVVSLKSHYLFLTHKTQSKYLSLPKICFTILSPGEMYIYVLHKAV